MKQLIFTIILFCFIKISNGQEYNIDSLAKKTFDELKENFKKSYLDTTKAITYADAYLNKAKKDFDTINISYAYYYLSQVHSDTIALSYTDSIITYNKKIEKEDLLASTYLQKGHIYYGQGKYKEALNQYLVALEYANKNNNEDQRLLLQMNIGLLKNNLGERKEALEIFRETFKNQNQNPPIRVLYALADSYIYNKENDSASLIIKKGINETLKVKDTFMYSYFVFSSGVNSYYKEKYNLAIDSLLKAQKLIDDKNLHLESNLYIGKSFNAINQNEKAIFYFEKVDSLLQETNNITPELIESYKVLINYYGNKKAPKKQLYYINSLLKFDSILDSNHKYLYKNIAENYEIPKLINEKEKLISELNRDKSLSKKTITVLTILGSFFLLVAFYFLRNNIVYKKRFNKLVSSNENSELKKESPTVSNDLSDEFVKSILVKLDKFENSNKFVKKNYTLNSLAKELKTNSAYLSKIINETKDMNFTNYLNDLKINYAIDKLKTNKQLQSYTIKAISEEVGFNNVQTFHLAFNKKTGISPSYFLKRLKTQI